MAQEKRVTLEEVLKTVGDEVGEKYTWFLIAFEAQGIIDEHVYVGDIRDKIKDLGYYEISWDFLRKISSRLYAVVLFNLIGSKSKEDFLQENAKVHNSADLVCELNFDIDDGEIWEITGKNTDVVERLKKTFSPLPIFLM